MKTIIGFILCLISFMSFGQTPAISQVLQERLTLRDEYTLLLDSVGLSQSVKLQLLDDKLKEITILDDSLLDNYARELLMKSDSISVADSKIAALSFENERMQLMTKNNLRMIMILKLSSLVLIIGVLVLIYLLFRRANNKSQIEELSQQVELLDDEKESLNQEISRLKAENSTFIINELHDERDKLQIEVNQLKIQVDEAKAKNKAIIQKIDKLISDLSAVHS